MLSIVAYEPQLVATATHVFSVVNSIRQASTSTFLPYKGRCYTQVNHQQRPELTKLHECKNDKHNGKNKLTMNNMDPDAIMKKMFPLTAAGLKDAQPCLQHMPTSFVSADTFFENKTGFNQLLLYKPVNDLSSSFKVFLNKDIQRILSRALLSPVFIQKRWFTPRQSQDKRGIGMKQGDQDQKGSIDKALSWIGLKETDDKKVEKELQIFMNDKNFTKTDVIMYMKGYKHHETKKKRNWLLMLAIASLCLYFISKFVSVSASDPASPGFRSLMTDKFELDPEEAKVTFADVRGCDEAKQELADIVSFLRQPEKFTSVGAKLPKGVLLVGSPGIGKTLLAKAVAGEAGVPFFHASGSEFDEVFVGSGARRVRNLFASAKRKAPCLIFIDEIDSVGAKRTNSTLHPYANQTINQLLSEMDGFKDNTGVIVIGATNRKDNIDSALLRPGRFDVEVNVLPPDVKGRQEIFELYLSKVHAHPSLDIERLAKLTYGMTGADIQNIVNQAALRVGIEGRDTVTFDDLEFARDKVIMGPQWQNKKIDKETNENTAYHEAGHALVAMYTKGASPVNKVTILPRGQSLGHTSFMNEKDLYDRTKAQILAEIDVAMGGRAAEELRFGAENVTTGASSDFQRATFLAKSMVKRYGMSDKVGTRVHSDNQLDGGTSFIQINDLSPELQKLVDSEIDRILNESYERALHILKNHPQEHQLFSEALLKYETLDLEEVKSVIKGKPLLNRMPKQNNSKPIPALPKRNNINTIV